MKCSTSCLPPGPYLHCSPSHLLKPGSITLFPLLGRVITLGFFPGSIQPCYSSAHCCLCDSRWGWESKASEVLVGADLVQQGSAIFRQFSGCLYTVRKGYLSCYDGKKGTQYFQGTFKIGFWFLQFPHWECCHFCSWDWDSLTVGEKNDKDSYGTSCIFSL